MALVFIGVLVAPVPVLAGQWEAKKADPFFGKRGIDDRAGFFLDGVSSSVETTVQVNSEAGIGSTILLERLFEVLSERDYARFQFYYRFSRKHGLNIQYLGTSSSGNVTLLDEEITIGDYTYEINARIGAQQKTRFGAIEYRYAFVNNGKAEAGIAAGLGLIDTNRQLFGEVTDSEGFTRIAGVEVNETIPLPVAGVHSDFTLTAGCSYRSRLCCSVSTTTSTRGTSATSGPLSPGTRRESSASARHGTAPVSMWTSKRRGKISVWTICSTAPRSASRS
jgi:hypothetical protein